VSEPEYDERNNAPALLRGNPLRRLKAEWIYRALLIAGSLLFLRVFPCLLFIVYMGTHGFFDYAFFHEGWFAMGVFYGTAELILVMLSVMTFGALIPWNAYRRRKEATALVQAGLFTALNVAILALFVAVAARSESVNWVDMAVLFALCAAISTHLAVLFSESARRGLFSLLMLFVVVGSLLAVAPKSWAGLLANGLRIYGVGADVPVTVACKGDNPLIGKLVFLGPRQLFMIEDGATHMTVLDRESCRLQVPLSKRSAK
jgi:hypothetical protein